jgi:hypothetical protein
LGKRKRPFKKPLSVALINSNFSDEDDDIFMDPGFSSKAPAPKICNPFARKATRPSVPPSGGRKDTILAKDKTQEEQLESPSLATGAAFHGSTSSKGNRDALVYDPRSEAIMTMPPLKKLQLLKEKLKEVDLEIAAVDGGAAAEWARKQKSFLHTQMGHEATLKADLSKVETQQNSSKAKSATLRKVHAVSVEKEEKVRQDLLKKEKAVENVKKTLHHAENNTAANEKAIKDNDKTIDEQESKKKSLKTKLDSVS